MGNPIPYRVGEQFAREIWPDVERQMVKSWEEIQDQLSVPEIHPNPISFETIVEATWIYSLLIDHAAAGGLVEVSVGLPGGYDTRLYWHERHATLWPTCRIDYTPSQFRGEGRGDGDGAASVEVRRPERVSKRFMALRERFRTQCRFHAPDSLAQFATYSWKLFRRP